jgi:hypothetical protein
MNTLLIDSRIQAHLAKLFICSGSAGNRRSSSSTVAFFHSRSPCTLPSTLLRWRQDPLGEIQLGRVRGLFNQRDLTAAFLQDSMAVTHHIRCDSLFHVGHPFPVAPLREKVGQNSLAFWLGSFCRLRSFYGADLVSSKSFPINRAIQNPYLLRFTVLLSPPILIQTARVSCDAR